MTSNLECAPVSLASSPNEDLIDSDSDVPAGAAAIIDSQLQASGGGVSITDSTCASVTSSGSRHNENPRNMAEANTSGIDRLFQRMKSDLMYELRNIQHGDRPVTGQGNRENIQHFLSKHFPTNDADGTSKENQLSNEAETETHRPESVVVEVQGIIERRPVSSILQSAAFRRQLENVIRGSIQSPRSPRGRNTSSTNQRASSTAASAPVASAPVPRPRMTVAAAAGPSSEHWPSTPGLPRPPPLMRQDSSDSISSMDSFSSARSSADLDEDFDLADSTEYAHEPEPALPQPAAQPSIPPQNHQRQDADTRQDTGSQNLSLYDISQMHQQDLVEEISELLHSRLVSSALDSQFRATLELHVQDRISASGTNGQAVQDFIRNLPASGVERNDFTDLGIPVVQDFENLDNVSVTNVSAHSVPYTQTNTHLSREIQGLKSQMMEMKNMLKLTFDLQMDIQRAIRQEVAAAMSQFAAAQGASASVGAAPVSSKPVNDTHCLICLERHSDCVLYQCGHMCVCYACGRDLVSRNLGCPVCRAPIKDVIRAYKTNVD